MNLPKDKSQEESSEYLAYTLTKKKNSDANLPITVGKFLIAVGYAIENQTMSAGLNWIWMDFKKFLKNIEKISNEKY